MAVGGTTPAPRFRQEGEVERASPTARLQEHWALSVTVTCDGRTKTTKGDGRSAVTKSRKIVHVWDKVPEEYPYFGRYPVTEFPYKTVYDRPLC